MNKGFIAYKKFNDVGLANELSETLARHNIDHKVEEESLSFNPAFNTDETSKDYVVKINAVDFTRVNEILRNEEAEGVEATGSEHYLYDFTNEELTDLVSKPDEWSEFDNLLAVKILKERGINITNETIKQLNNKRLEHLKQPGVSPTFGIVVGYLVALLGGALGIFIGWYLAYSKKTLPNGEQVFNYTEADRVHGKRIFYLSIGVLIVIFILRILRSDQ